MRKCDMRKELRIGLAINVLALVVTQSEAAPELLKGFLLGMAICLMLIGILPEKSYQKLKEVKRSLINGGKQY